MCTVSWFRDDGRLELLFNRDERRTRAPARAPQALTAGARRFLAPLDGDHGGSWIAANDLGLIVGLLNGYAATDAGPEPEAGFISRGLLVTSLIDEPTVDGVVARLRRLDLERYRSFVLFAVRHEEPARAGRWDGRRLIVEDESSGMLPLVSSSFESAEVCRSRRRVFREREARLTDDAARLRFHESHVPRRGPYSVCMHREDARTVSLTRVVVDASTVRVDYAAHSPCRGGPRPIASLERVALEA